MSDDLVKRLRNPPFGTETSERNLMASAADALDTQAAEITRLRAALATARREGMEEAAKIAWDYAERLEDMAELSRYPHVKREHEGRSWVAQTIAAAIRAAAKEDREP